MLISLFGPDSYRRTEKVKELIAAYRMKYPLADLLMIDLEDDPESWVGARDFLRQPSMFVDSKVLSVREPAFAEVSAGKLAREWSEVLKEAMGAKGVVVILSAEKDPAESASFLAHKSVERQEFRELEGRILEMFISREAKVRGIVFNSSAQRFFLNYLESLPSRSARAITELDRMMLARFPSPVTRENLERLTAWLPSEELYRGTQLISTGRTALERLMALERLLLQGEASAKIFNIIGYSSSGASAVALAAYDIAAKSGRLEYEEALTDFAVSATGNAGIRRAEVFLKDVI